MQDDEDLADGDRLVADAGLVKEKKGLLGPKKEADYDYFVSDIWPRISTKEEKQSMTAPLVWQVLLFVGLHVCSCFGHHACWLRALAACLCLLV